MTLRDGLKGMTVRGVEERKKAERAAKKEANRVKAAAAAAVVVPPPPVTAVAFYPAGAPPTGDVQTAAAALLGIQLQRPGQGPVHRAVAAPRTQSVIPCSMCQLSQGKRARATACGHCKMCCLKVRKEMGFTGPAGTCSCRNAGAAPAAKAAGPLLDINLSHCNFFLTHILILLPLCFSFYSANILPRLF
jgi:hypothetical protein